MIAAGPGQLYIFKASDQLMQLCARPQSNDTIRFDLGEEGVSGHRGKDHYHCYNSDTKDVKNPYIDKNGNPCAKGSDESHLYPGD